MPVRLHERPLPPGAFDAAMHMQLETSKTRIRRLHVRPRALFAESVVAVLVNGIVVESPGQAWDVEMRLPRRKRPVRIQVKCSGERSPRDPARVMPRYGGDWWSRYQIEGLHLISPSLDRASTATSSSSHVTRDRRSSEAGTSTSSPSERSRQRQPCTPRSTETASLSLAPSAASQLISNSASPRSYTGIQAEMTDEDLKAMTADELALELLELEERDSTPRLVNRAKAIRTELNRRAISAQEHMEERGAARVNRQQASNEARAFRVEYGARQVWRRAGPARRHFDTRKDAQAFADWWCARASTPGDYWAEIIEQHR